MATPLSRPRKTLDNVRFSLRTLRAALLIQTVVMLIVGYLANSSQHLAVDARDAIERQAVVIEEQKAVIERQGKVIRDAQLALDACALAR